MKSALALSLLSPLLLALMACTAPRDPETAADPAGTAPVEAAPPAAAPPADAPPPAQPPTAQACDADAANGAIGRTATTEVIEEARIAAGAVVARTLAPGQVVTMEFRGDRLNLMVDEANVVTGVRCG